MPLYIADYLGDTQHLTALQHGAYLLLIMHYWQHGSLPDDERTLALISKLGNDWSRNREAIAKLFLPHWRHKRVDAELFKAHEISAKRALFGAIGGRHNRGLNNQQRYERAANREAIAKQKVAYNHIVVNSESEERARARGTEPPQEVADGSNGTLDIVKSKSIASDELAALVKTKWVNSKR
jgi:uncharacterized protein YdaU (DUF1376 family)